MYEMHCVYVEDQANARYRIRSWKIEAHLVSTHAMEYMVIMSMASGSGVAWMYYQ